MLKVVKPHYGHQLASFTHSSAEPGSAGVWSLVLGAQGLEDLRFKEWTCEWNMKLNTFSDHETVVLSWLLYFLTSCAKQVLIVNKITKWHMLFFLSEFQPAKKCFAHGWTIPADPVWYLPRFDPSGSNWQPLRPLPFPRHNLLSSRRWIVQCASVQRQTPGSLWKHSLRSIDSIKIKKCQTPLLPPYDDLMLNTRKTYSEPSVQVAFRPIEKRCFGAAGRHQIVDQDGLSQLIGETVPGSRWTQNQVAQLWSKNTI